MSAKNQRAAAAAAARRTKQAEESREKMLLRLYKIRDAASIRELEILAGGGFTKADLRDLSNARRFAVHDAELLAGFPTERTENLVDRDEIITAVQFALVAALELVPVDLRNAVSAAFALALREASEHTQQLTLSAGDEVEDGDFEPVTEETA